MPPRRVGARRETKRGKADTSMSTECNPSDVRAKLPELTIHASNHTAGQLWCVIGMTSLVLVPLSTGFFLAGDVIPGLSLTAVLIAAGLFAAWCNRVTPPVFAKLTNQRLTITECGNSETVIEWENIVEIRWPSGSGEHLRIRVRHQDREQTDLQTTFIDVENARASERATFIAYLRSACAHAKQEGWPRFCVRYAERLLERPDEPNSDSGLRDNQQETSRPVIASLLARSLRWANRHPFVAGLLAPVLLLAVFITEVSRELYWMTSLIVVVSTWINVRLFWGQWLAPFTSTCFVFAVVLFLMGCLASPIRDHDEKHQLVSWPVAAFWFYVALVGGPLIINAMAVGRIPPGFSRLAFWAIWFAMHAPIIWGLWKLRMQQKREAVPGSDTLQRWDQFEASLFREASDLPAEDAQSRHLDAIVGS